MKSTTKANVELEPPRVVSREAWLEARRTLLTKEKAYTRLHDEIMAERRALPWVKIDKEYVFDTPQGRRTLAELFAGRSQLVVRHFMFGPDWEQGCVGCSFASDHVDSALPHLNHHDVTYIAVSRAPLAKIEAFKRRMGWRFPWVSSFGSDFNFYFHVSFTPEELERRRAIYNFEEREMQHASDEGSGLSAFYRDAKGNVYHTYSAFARGDEGASVVYFLLDLTAKGRAENGPNFNLGDWVRHHDRYDDGLVSLGTPAKK